MRVCPVSWVRIPQRRIAAPPTGATAGRAGYTPRMFLTLLLACAGSEDTAPVADLEGCHNGPSIEITSPESSARLTAGADVTLSMEVSSEVDGPESLRLLWNVFKDGASDDDNVGTHTTETWTPTAEDVGIWTIRAQVEDTCVDELGIAPVQDSVRVEVVP